MATIVSGFSATVNASVAVTSWWLKDPVDSTANMAIKVLPDHNVHRREQSTAFYPLGRTRPVVVADTITGADGQIDVLTLTAADYTALLVLVNRQRVLLLQSPFLEQWYVRLMGDRSTKLVASASANPYRTTTLVYVETDTP